MKEPNWIDAADCLACHDELLARHGGLPGVRDEGALHSALHREQQRFHYRSPTIHELAATYASGIVRNHPFNGGNKRSGFLAAALFLEINGYRFIAEEQDVVAQTLALAAGDLNEEGYASWLASVSQPLPTRDEA